MHDQDYPSFSVGEDGLILQDGSDVNGVIDPPSSSPDPSSLHGTVSSGDLLTGSGNSVVPPLATGSGNSAVPPSWDSSVLLDIQEDLERIVNEQASTSGYLSSSALDVFDRVVSGYDYDYYCAFRYDDDNYNAIMYLSDFLSRSGSSVVLSDALCVRLYRTYSSSSRVYSYYYAISRPGDVSISLSGNRMYYTNCSVGYPVLGSSPAPGRYPGWLVPLCATFFVCAMILFFRRNRK